MKKLIKISVLAYLVQIAYLDAEIQVRLEGTESVGSKASVRLSMKNNMGQGIKGARAWVFLMDNDGKVVANRAEWIIEKGFLFGKSRIGA